MRKKNPTNIAFKIPLPPKKKWIEDYLFLLYSCNDDILIKNLTTIAQCCKHVIMIFRWICNLGNVQITATHPSRLYIFSAPIFFFFRKRGGWSSKRFSVSFYIAKYYILRYIDIVYNFMLGQAKTLPAQIRNF